MGIVSYAQNFEDVILWRALEDATPGFYIDVGAQHPVVDSVSKAFYEKGWRGIHVEPTSEYANLLRADRPDETVIQAIVAEQPGVQAFYEIPGGGLSTARQDIAEQHRVKLGCSIIKNLVTAVTLDDVLALAPGEIIHWLKIDVEGNERQVLAGWRKSIRRPWVMVIESTYPNSMTDTSKDWEELVLAKGYNLVYRDGLNRYYLHQSKNARKVRFEFPPNVFDGFQLSGKSTSLTVALVQAQQIESGRLVEEKAQAQQEVTRLKAEHQNVLAERDSSKNMLENLVDQVVARQQTSAIEQMKVLFERERAHAEKLEALSEAWRRADAEQRAQAEAARRQTLEDAQKHSDVERAELGGRLAEMRAALQTAQKVAEVRQQELLERERAHAEKLEALRDAWRRAEAELGAQAEAARRHALEEAQRHLDAERVQLEVRLAETRTALQTALQVADVCQQELADRERAHAEELEALREAWREEEAEQGAQAEAAKRQALEDAQKSSDAERAELEGHLAEMRAALQTAQQVADVREQQLADRERAHAEKLEVLNEDWQRVEADRNAEIVDLKTQQSILSEEAHAYAEKTKLRIEDLIAHVSVLHDELVGIYQSRWGRLLRKMPSLLCGWPKKSVLTALPSLDALLANADVDVNLGSHSIDFGPLARYEYQSLNRRYMKIQSVNDLLEMGGDALIEAAYVSILGRSPDPEGRSFYLSKLSDGMNKSDFIAELAISREGRARCSSLPGLPRIVKDYKASRAWPLGWWFRRLKLERAVNRLENKVDVLSQKVTHRTQNNESKDSLSVDWLRLNDVDCVKYLYQVLLGRAPDNGGFEYYVGQMRQGKNRIDILIDIAQSQEARSYEAIMKAKSSAASSSRPGEMKEMLVNTRDNTPYEEVFCPTKLGSLHKGINNDQRTPLEANHSNYRKQS